jgi:hypothetical protein
MIGIREDRIMKTGTDREILYQKAFDVGFQCIEAVLTQMPVYGWWKPYEDYTVTSACLDYWLKHDWISSMTDIWTGDGARFCPVHIEIKQDHIPHIILPCFKASRVDDELRLGLLHQLIMSVPEDYRSHILLEADLQVGQLLEICEVYGISLCYDLGNERTRRNGKLPCIKELAPHIKEIHLKNRAWGKEDTIHLPEDHNQLSWFKKRVVEIRKGWKGGNVILETPAHSYKLEQNFEAASWCMDGDYE